MDWAYGIRKLLESVRLLTPSKLHTTSATCLRRALAAAATPRATVNRAGHPKDPSRLDATASTLMAHTAHHPKGSSNSRYDTCRGWGGRNPVCLHPLDARVPGQERRARDTAKEGCLFLDLPRRERVELI
eukprot:scaffold13908_cov106-Isochrysis_galbana.AAC.11